jgi:hypothetical protein
VIDIKTEPLIPIATVTHIVPPARSGRETHLSTILRWILRGTKAPDGTVVRLEAVRLGGRWMTSREALQRFAERLTPRLAGDTEETSTPRSPSARRRAHARATKELEQHGI